LLLRSIERQPLPPRFFKRERVTLPHRSSSLHASDTRGAIFGEGGSRGDRSRRPAAVLHLFPDGACGGLTCGPGRSRRDLVANAAICLFEVIQPSPPPFFLSLGQGPAEREFYQSATRPS